MKINRRKITAVLCCMILLAACTAATLAYLTDSQEIRNTFSVGNVEIKLDESKVTTGGVPVAGADRVTENKYHLLPGKTYVKDPTVTVLKGSESAYVRMKVTFSFASQLDGIFAPYGADFTAMFNGYDSSKWQLAAVTEDAAANTRTYEFRYTGAGDGVVSKNDSSDTVLPPLFRSITVPGEITKEQLAKLVVKDGDGKITDQFTISVIAEAIQADGFDNAGEAWKVFR